MKKIINSKFLKLFMGLFLMVGLLTGCGHKDNNREYNNGNEYNQNDENYENHRDDREDRYEDREDRYEDRDDKYEEREDKNDNDIDDKAIEELKDTRNFKYGSLEHIFEGEINGRGKAVGFHYENFPGTEAKVIEGTRSKPNKYGVYTGEVEVEGVRKSANNGKSTFFPKNWTPQQVVNAINEAYDNKEYVEGSKNTFIGETKNGMEISMYIDDRNGKIISAFPIY